MQKIYWNVTTWTEPLEYIFKKITTSLIHNVLESTRLDWDGTFSIVASKCYCENKIGSGDYQRNGIICEEDGRRHRHTYCADDEWCIGATDSTNATYEVDSLCVKGNSVERYNNGN